MSEPLRVGERSPRVAEVRATLARLGLIPGYKRDVSGGLDGSYVSEDTFYDEELAEAVQGFQQSRGIIANGEIGEATLRVLREASYHLGARVLIYQPGGVMVGDDVAQLQQNLTELGFYAARIDGHYGPDTHEAVRTYQLNYGLQADGICGPKTIRALSYLGKRITGGNPHAMREREQVRQAGPQLAGKRVVIDPDLGGNNRGYSVKGPWGFITEEEILWDIATRIEGRMIAASMETIMSRPRFDDPSHMQRADIANAFGANLMLCLRCDTYPNEKANGCATFFFGSESGASSLSGEHLSSLIQREITARTKLTNCGSHARTWDMLRLTQMPTIEIVTGYLTNDGDVKKLTDPHIRDTIAESVVIAVKRFYLLDRDDMETGTFRFADILRQELVD